MNKLTEARDAVAVLSTEIRELSELDDITTEQDARLDEAVAELPAREALVVTLEARQVIIDRAALAPAQDSTRASAILNVPNVIKRKADLHDMSDMRYGAPVGEVRDRARAVIDATSGLEARHQEQAEHVMAAAEGDVNGAVARHIVATSSPAYRSAFQKFAGGQADLLNEDERNAVTQMRAASLTNSAGGFAVPFNLDPTIIDTGSHSTNPFRQISRTVQTVTDSWNGVSSAGVSARWAAEASEAGDNAPTLAQPSISVHKGDVFVPFSIEVGMDWASMESDVRNMITRAKDDLEGAAFATGSGSGQPKGVITALDGTASEIAPATGETFAIGDVYALESALQARYRSNADFVANKIWYNAIRQFDTNGGAGLWERIGAAMPPELLGYSTYESSDMDGVLPDAAATADNFGLLFGDFSNFVIVDRVGLSVELVPHLFAEANNRPNGQRGFYAYFRTGADVVNTAGIKVLSIPTTA
jgi:HK97 family phage major capsid protein